jgi:hypothetical protein
MKKNSRKKIIDTPRSSLSTYRYRYCIVINEQHLISKNLREKIGSAFYSRLDPDPGDLKRAKLREKSIKKTGTGN